MSDRGAPHKLGETKRSALKLTAQMSMASIIGKVVGFPVGMVTTSVLGPAGYGLLSVAGLVQRYAGYADMGMKYSLSRQVPILLGRGDEEESRLVSAIVLTWFAMVSTVAVTVLWLLYAWGFSFKNLLTLPNLVLVSLLLLSNRVNTYYHNYVKGYGLFDAIGSNSFISNVIGPLITLPFVVWLHITGALLAQLFVSLLVGANYLRHIIRHGRFQVRLMLPWGKTLELVRLSLLLYVNNLSEGLLESIAMTLLAFFATVDQVGLFGYALGIATFGIGIASGFNLVIDRRMLRDWGAEGFHAGYAHFRRYMESPLVIYLLFLSGAVGLAYFGYEVLVRLFIPEFIPALVLAQVVAFGQMSAAITRFFRMYFNATDQLVSRLVLVWGGLLIHLLLNFVFLSLGYGALGVALGMSLGYAVYAILLMVASARQIYGRIAVGGVLLGRLLLVSLLLALCLHLLTGWQPAWIAAPSKVLNWAFELVVAGARLAIYSGLVLLLYSLVFRQYRPEREIYTTLMYMTSALRSRLRGKLGYSH